MSGRWRFALACRPGALAIIGDTPGPPEASESLRNSGCTIRLFEEGRERPRARLAEKK